MGASDEQIYEGDTFRNVLHMSSSKGFFKNRYSSIYRFNKKGIWSQKSNYEMDKLNYHAFNQFSKIFREDSLYLLSKARIFIEKIINNYFIITYIFIFRDINYIIFY